jgi:hypothetical protein
VQHVLLRKWGDRLSVGHLPNSLVSLLKANSYNHVPSTSAHGDRSMEVLLYGVCK